MNQEMADFKFLNQGGNDELDLEYLWKIIQNKRWFVFTVTAIAFTVSLLYGLKLPNVYTASVKILVEPMDQSAYQNPEILKPDVEYGSVYYETRATVLESRPILGKTAEQLKLSDYYQKRQKRILNNEDVIDILSKQVKVKVLRGTQIIELTVTDREPEMAGKIANAISETFVRESWRERLFISDQLLKWFPKEGETLKENSPISQLQKLDDLEQGDAILSLPSVLRDPAVNNIKQERLKVDAEIRELSRRYTPEHPKMKELLARADYLESEMKAQIDKIISGLKSGLAGEFSVANVKVIESAAVPRNPSGPKRLVIIFVCTILSFLGSVTISVLLRQLDQNIRTEDDVKKVPLTFLGFLPPIVELNGIEKEGDRPEHLLSHIVSNRLVTDEVSNVRTSILFSMPAERSKLIMCTSAIPEEGKTTVVSMLGISLAQMGERVLLVDADMRKPALHLVFGIENKTGLTNCLVGSSQPQEVIRTIESIPGLHIMTSGESTPNPAILLGSTVVDRLIERFESEYDRIIFDVSPSLHIADGLILTGKVHGTIFVFDSGKIHQNVARKLKDRIASANGVIIGGIVNRSDYKKLDYPYYQYYRQYSKYYHSNDSVGTIHSVSSGQSF